MSPPVCLPFTSLGDVLDQESIDYYLSNGLPDEEQNLKTYLFNADEVANAQTYVHAPVLSDFWSSSQTPEQM